MARLTQSFYLIGSLSAIFIGYLSDRFGRRIVCLTIIMILALAHIGCQFLQFEFVGLSDTAQFVVYSISQFLYGMCCNGIFSVSYTLLIELNSSKHTSILTNIDLCIYVLGELVIMVVAYFSQNWKFVDWFIAGYALLVFAVCFFLMPESPKYLIDMKKTKELDLYLKKVAKINGKVSIDNENIKMPNIVDEKMSNETESSKERSQDEEKNTEKEDREVIMFILKSKDLLIKAIFLSIIWFSVEMAYFGVSLGKNDKYFRMRGL